MRSFGRRTLAAALPAFAAARPAAQAQTLADIDQRGAAVIAAWEKTPLTVRRAIFLAQRPTGFGMYEPRPANVFKPGEPLLVYAEPVGYGWKALDNGMFEFGFAIDFVVKTAGGEVLGGRDDFARLVQRSRVRNMEFLVTLTLDLTGVPEGDLVLSYKLRDVTGPKETTVELPFSVRA